MDIKVHYLNGSPQLEQVSNGGCVDLYMYEDVNLQEGECGIFSLGVSMKLPQGYDAIILPRSSTFKRYGILLTNSIGYIDNSYCGTDDIWKVSLYATRPVHIEKGTRCFQFRLVPVQEQICFQECLELNNDSRGGFGSTGV